MLEHQGDTTQIDWAAFDRTRPCSLSAVAS